MPQREHNNTLTILFTSKQNMSHSNGKNKTFLKLLVKCIQMIQSPTCTEIHKQQY